MELQTHASLIIPHCTTCLTGVDYRFFTAPRAAGSFSALTSGSAT